MQEDNTARYDEWLDEEYWWFEQIEIAKGSKYKGDYLVYGRNAYDSQEKEWKNNEWIRSNYWVDSQERL